MTLGPLADADVVAVSQVSKWFGEVTALDRVSLVVPPGEVHGLVGPNGAGKSTLLSILFGITRQDEGEVRLFGRTRAQARAAWLDGVGGFVETPRFYPHLTGRGNLRVLADLDGGDAFRLVDEALDLVGLRGTQRQKVRDYSLGMRQRLGLAAAAIRRPRLLVLDEPTNGMDPGGITNLRRALRTLAARGLSVLFSSHDIRQVDELCDSVTVLDRGVVVFSGTAQRLRAEAPDAQWRVRTADDVAAAAIAADLNLPFLLGRPGAAELTADEAALTRWTVACGRAGIGLTLLEQRASPLQVLMQRLVAPAESGHDDQRTPAGEATAPAVPASAP